VTLKGKYHDPNKFGANYVENVFRYGLKYNRAPTGNDTRASSSHVSLKGQGHDQDMFGCKYLEKDER